MRAAILTALGEINPSSMASITTDPMLASATQRRSPESEGAVNNPSRTHS